MWIYNSVFKRVKQQIREVSKDTRNGFFFMFFSLLNQGISFLLLFVIAKYITNEDYGFLSLFYTIVQLVSYFVALSTQGYISIAFFQKTRENFIADFTRILIISIVVIGLLSLAICWEGKALIHFVRLDIQSLWVALGIAYGTIICQMLLDYERLTEKIFQYGLISATFSLLQAFLALYLIVEKGYSWEGRIYSHLFVSAIFVIIAFITFFRKGLLTLRIFNKKEFKNLILWGLPLIPHLATMWIRQGCDRYIIVHYHTLSDVGVFSFALNLSNIIITLGAAYNSSNVVTIYQWLSGLHKNRSEIRKIRNKGILIYGLIAIGTFVCGSTIVYKYMPQFYHSISYFLLLSFYAFLQCCYFLYCNYLFYFKQNNQIMKITFTTSILHFICSLLLTPYSLYLTCIIYITTQAIVLYLVSQKANQIIKQEIYERM